MSEQHLQKFADFSQEIQSKKPDGRPRAATRPSVQPETGALRLVVADDTMVYCDGLAALFSEQSAFDVVARVADGRSAIEACETHNPDVLLCELRLPKLRGADLLEQCIAAWPSLKIIGMSRFFDAAMVWEALQAGADGLITKSCSFTELCAMIDQVKNGAIVLGPQIQDVLVRRAIRNQEHTNSRRLAELTRREREVAQLLVEGQSPKQIAYELHVSAKTADSHRYQILRKLGLRNIADLTRLAVLEGMTHVD